MPATSTAPEPTVTATKATTAKKAKKATRLRVNPIACSGHGVCAELLPELISLDEWGYPVIADAPIPASLLKQARRVVTDCPALALMLAATDR
jgi:ferredoxin